MTLDTVWASCLQCVEFSTGGGPLGPPGGLLCGLVQDRRSIFSAAALEFVARTAGALGVSGGEFGGGGWITKRSGGRRQVWNLPHGISNEVRPDSPKRWASWLSASAIKASILPGASFGGGCGAGFGVGRWSAICSWMVLPFWSLRSSSRERRRIRWDWARARSTDF